METNQNETEKKKRKNNQSISEYGAISTQIPEWKESREKRKVS